MILRLWRFILISIGAFAILVAVMVLGRRLTHPDSECLYLDKNPFSLVELNTEKSFSYPTWTPELTLPGIGPTGPYALSPDGKRVAHFIEPNSNRLTVQDFIRPVPTERKFDFFTGLDATTMDILWSPDGNFIAYHWHEGAEPNIQQYLAIADRNGKLLRQTKLNVAPNDLVSFDRWSPDDKYIVLVNRPDSGGRVIAFWSVPDLEPVDIGEHAQNVGAGCEDTFMGSSWMRCAQWTAHGHTAAYTLTEGNGKVQLVITSLDNSAPRVFDLPESINQTVRWSPNGEFVAVASYSYGANFDATDSRVDLYGVDGTVHSEIGRAVEANLETSDVTIYAEMQWMLDGHDLIYARLNSSDKSKYDIVAYEMQTGETRQLLTAPNNILVEPYFYVSPDNQTIAIILNYSDLYLVSRDGKLLQQTIGASPAWDEVFWSPDSQKIAFAVNDPTSNKSTVKVISKKGVNLAQFNETSPVTSITWTRCGVQ